MSEQSTKRQQDSRQALRAELCRLSALFEAFRASAALPVLEFEAPAGSAVGMLVRKFGLTSFERDLLLSAAAMELDSDFAHSIGSLQGNERRPAMTFSLALSVFAGPHWSALAPASVLRHARLIRMGEGSGLVDAPIHAEEAVLHYLNGVGGLDARLRPYASRLHASPLPPSFRAAAERLVEAWSQRDEDGNRKKPHLTGLDGSAARSMVASACAALDLTAYGVETGGLPADRAQLEELVNVWERDAVLFEFALLVDTSHCDQPERRSLANWLANRLRGVVVFAGDYAPVTNRAALVRVAAQTPSLAEQTDLWRDALGPAAASLNGHLGRMVEQFQLTPGGILEASEEVRAAAVDSPVQFAARAWSICRRRARGGLDDLARRTEARATWDDLILPDAQMETLHSMVFSMRHRYQVHEEWGFRARSARGLGTSALFWGPSGAGKTLAAEVLANELALDLFRIDLSASVSKYIGETEKNLRRLFDAAEASGAILLFDEADALFGKRTEVKDSHDRYANLEVSYLLQRMESYRGLAILTTNLKNGIDAAFLRRIRFVVQFPFPSAAERERIWKRVFPSGVPLDAAIDWSRLSRLAVTGGNIANIALDAAYRAANDGSTVHMRHLLDAARAECAKIEKPLAENETRGWV